MGLWFFTGPISSTLFKNLSKRNEKKEYYQEKVTLKNISIFFYREFHYMALARGQKLDNTLNRLPIKKIFPFFLKDLINNF